MTQTRILLSLLLLLLTSCAPLANSFFATDPGRVEVAPQNYNVIFYGAKTPHDVESMVVLDIADDDYTIKAAASPFNFSRQDNLTSAASLDSGQDFLGKLLWLRKVDKLQIIAPDGTLIGYELRPVFYEMQVDNNNFRSWYTLNEENMVKFYVSWAGTNLPFDRD